MISRARLEDLPMLVEEGCVGVEAYMPRGRVRSGSNFRRGFEELRKGHFR